MKKKTFKKIILGLGLSFLLTLTMGTIASANPPKEITEASIREEAVDADDILANTPKAYLPSIDNMWQSGVSATSAKISWTGVSGATHYQVSIASSGTDNFKVLGDTTATSYTITGLKVGSRYDVRVLPKSASDTSNYYTRLPIYTKPGSVGVKDIIVSGQNSQITMKSHSYTTVTGYRVTYNNLKTKGKVTKRFTSSGRFVQKLNPNAFYKIQIRPLMRLNGKDYYASKDTVIYTALQPKLSKAGATSSSMTVKWSTVYGADNYSVYIKKPGQSSYKKVTTTKSKSYKLTGMKNNQTYHIYVTANNKIGSKTWKSVKSTYYTMRVYTVYR